MILVIAIAGGCVTSKKKDYPPTVARFMLEAAPDEAGVTVRLPKSGSTITIAPKSYFTEFDIVKCEVLDNELGKCLVFQLTPQAGRDLYRLTATNQGRRIVTAINAVAIGARRIERPIGDGYIVTYVEADEKELADLAKNVTRTSRDAQAELEKKGK